LPELTAVASDQEAPGRTLAIQIDRFTAVHESLSGPSRQILRWNLMSAFEELRTSREADTKRIGSE